MSRQRHPSFFKRKKPPDKRAWKPPYLTAAQKGAVIPLACLLALWSLQCRGLPAIREIWIQSWVGKIPWRRKWWHTLLFLPGEFHGQRRLVGYSPWGHRVGHDWMTNNPSIDTKSLRDLMSVFQGPCRHIFFSVHKPLRKLVFLRFITCQMSM